MAVPLSRGWATAKIGPAIQPIQLSDQIRGLAQFERDRGGSYVCAALILGSEADDDGAI